jgi:hypothetical protein
MTASATNLPRDTFLYLLAVITLVVVATGFGMAVFSYIDFYFPDPATDYYGSVSSYEWLIIRAMAMLIVVFPAFFWVSRFLKRDVDTHPEKKELKIRKWLLNLTLFAAALMIIGDFIAVINSFLTGELTMRFVLKALAMFFISGSIFYYYLAQLKEKNVKWLDLFSWVIVAIVVLTVAWGFAVIGSPFQQRNKRFDERRVQDLQIMQNYITNYWQNKERLPVSLSDLEDPLLGIVIPVDPETGGLYEYRVTDDLIFELCAMFSTESKYGQGAVPEMYSRGSQNYSWQHGVGRICFERTIDPDFFEKGKAVPRPL